jgi:DNA (cytosine-5)-methyltransferase 1
MATEPTVLAPSGVISFFSGCGILDLGFERAGFRVWMANEINGAFADAYEFARAGMDAPAPAVGGVVRDGIGSFFAGANRALLERAMAEARRRPGSTGFIGGPPCPDFSIAGKQAGRTGDRGRLTQDYFDLIGMLRPDFFLFENVKGLRSTAKHRAFLDEILQAVDADGYEVTERLVNAIDYGAPQDRARVIVVGFHRAAFPGGRAKSMAQGFAWDFRATHRQALACAWPGAEPLERDPVSGETTGAARPCPAGMPDRMRELTVQHWFDLNGVSGHANARDVFAVRNGLARMRRVREGDTSSKSFKRLHRWRYSPTAAYGNNEVHLHPYLDRRLSAAEAMAIQTLPPEFTLPPGMTLSAKFKTIGNGVPLKLAEALALTVAAALGGAVARPFGRDPARGRTPPPPAAVQAPDGGADGPAGGGPVPEAA